MSRKLNILIIGPTNVGKSALCNVLCDTNNFEESDYTAKKTRNFQEKNFIWKETEYHVMEIGAGSIEKKDLYNKIGEVMPEGLSQILLVIDERITAENIEIINLFFKSDILDYVTIVRTKFENFKVKEKCEEDKSQACYESETVAEIVKSCKGIIYVDSPPINIHIEDDDDRKRVKNNEKIRKRSREILLDHLESTCQKRYYKLKTYNGLLSYNPLSKLRPEKKKRENATNNKTKSKRSKYNSYLKRKILVLR